jgi:hypothetical protein
VYKTVFELLGNPDCFAERAAKRDAAAAEYITATSVV